VPVNYLRIGYKMKDEKNLPPSIWLINSAEKEPRETIIKWSIYEATFEDNSKSRHLVGFIENQFGRATSAIEKWNAKSKEITTRSGRVYFLDGPTGYDGDANYVWGNWKSTNQVISAIDVSEEY